MDELDGEEMPRAIVEAFLDRERGVRRLLDDLQRQAIEGRQADVRERVRALAETDEAVFYTVAFSLADSDRFFGDVEAQLDVTAADRLRDLADTYGSLADHFAVVRTETTEDRHNPVTDLGYAVSYHRGIESPVISYRPQSGGVDLFESRGTPSEVLGLTTDLVRATTDALEVALEEGYTVNTDELGDLIERRDELEAALADLQDDIDELRRTPLDEE